MFQISAFEKHTSRYVIVTLPRTTQADFIYNLKVNYDEKFNVKLSTTVPKSKTTETVTYTVPGFLQPYRVKITSNPDGAFMIYWAEPYVPYYIDRYYYQVNIYPGVNISTNVEKYYVTRPVIIYKGNESVYTFIVGFVSHDRQHRSLFTRPIVASLNGETRGLGDEEWFSFSIWLYIIIKTLIYMRDINNTEWIFIMPFSVLLCSYCKYKSSARINLI